MDLRELPELGRFRDDLERADVADVESLAAWEDLLALADRTGISSERLESFRDAARGRIGTALTEAGVGDDGDLAKADLDEISRRTGIARAHLERYRGRVAPDRVLLLDAPVARVRVQGREIEVPVVLAERDEEPYVLVRAADHTATLRIEGRTHADLPLYKTRGGEDVRVRVAEIRARDSAPPAPAPAPPAKKGFLARLRGK